MKRMSDSGFHPILPLSHVELGDYGYFDGEAWRKMGNIYNLKGYRCSFHKSTLEYGDQDIFIAHEVELKALTQAEVTTELGDAKCRLSFSKAGGYYMECKLHKLNVFDSIDFEVKKHLEKLKNAGLWQSEYRLVVGVVYASPCFAAFACSTGASVDFNIDIKGGITPTSDTFDAKLSTGLALNNHGVEIVDRPNTNILYPIGFQVVKYSRDWLGRKVIRYAGDGNVINYTYQDNFEDGSSAIFG